jgi:hypothetical protein
MLRDERFWDNPEEFRPERFLEGLKDGQVDPKSLIFGFGRRFGTHLLQSPRFSANSEDQGLPWTRHGKPARSSYHHDPPLGFRNHSR